MKMPLEVARGSLVENLPMIENPSLAENLSGLWRSGQNNEDSENALFSKSHFEMEIRVPNLIRAL